MIIDLAHSWLFLTILPIVAFLYASVGHGGASGYLALMALFSFATETMKPTALLLNLFVAAIAFYHYYKAGYFNKKLFLSFALASIPMAFLGGMIDIDGSIYKRAVYGNLSFIRMVKGEDHSPYLTLCKQVLDLDHSPPDFIGKLKCVFDMYDIFICLYYR